MSERCLDREESIYWGRNGNNSKGKFHRMLHHQTLQQSHQQMYPYLPPSGTHMEKQTLIHLAVHKSVRPHISKSSKNQVIIVSRKLGLQSGSL